MYVQCRGESELWKINYRAWWSWVNVRRAWSQMWGIPLPADQTHHSWASSYSHAFLRRRRIFQRLAATPGVELKSGKALLNQCSRCKNNQIFNWWEWALVLSSNSCSGFLLPSIRMWLRHSRCKRKSACKLWCRRARTLKSIYTCKAHGDNTMGWTVGSELLTPDLLEGPS